MEENKVGVTGPDVHKLTQDQKDMGVVLMSFVRWGYNNAICDVVDEICEGEPTKEELKFCRKLLEKQEKIKSLSIEETKQMFAEVDELIKKHIEDYNEENPKKKD